MKSEINFEKALSKLEQIVSELEAGKVSLDDSITLFEEGIQLIKKCDLKLKEVESRIEEDILGNCLDVLF